MIRIRNFRRDVLLFFYFITVFAFMPTNLSTDRIVWMTSSFLLLISTFVDVFAGRVKFFLFHCCVSYVIFVFYGILSMIWSDNTILTINYLVTKFPFILIGVMCVSSYMKNEDNIEHIFKIIVLSACIASVRFCYYTPWGDYQRGAFGTLLDPNTNYNAYTTPLSLGFAFSAYYALEKKEKWALLTMLFLSAVLVLAGSRKTIVLIPLITLFFSVNSSNWKSTIKNCLVFLVMLISGYVAITTIPQLSSIYESLVNVYNAFILGEKSGVGNSTEERIYLAEMAKEVWLQHPFLGVGWNNFRYKNYLGLYAHNNYYELLASLGIVGFILYYSIHFRALAYVYLKRKKRVAYNKFVLGILFTMFFLELGALPIYSREAMLLYLLSLCVYERTSEQKVYKLRIRL